MDKSKIRVILEYEFRRGTKASQTTKNINEIFGENSINERSVRRWFVRFRSGCFNLENIQNEQRGKHLSKVNNDELKSLLIEGGGKTKTTRELANMFNVTKSTILQHLKQIDMVKRKAGWSPRKSNKKTKKSAAAIVGTTTTTTTPTLKEEEEENGERLIYPF